MVKVTRLKGQKKLTLEKRSRQLLVTHENVLFSEASDRLFLKSKTHFRLKGSFPFSVFKIGLACI